MMKRPLVGAMLVALAASALAACGDDGETRGTSSTTDASSSGPGTGGSDASASSTGGAGVGGGNTGGTGTGGTGGAGGGQTDLPVGSACSDDAQCADADCLSEEESGWPAGYCTAACDQDTPCPSGSECVQFQNGDTLCLATCPVGSGSGCNDGYDCYDLDDTVAVCVAGCKQDSQCTVLPACNVDYGVCVDKEVCDDGVDNDLDGLQDCSDDDCAATCQGPIDMACMGAMTPQPTNMGDTTGGKDLFAGSCAGGGSPEQLYTYTAAEDGKVTINLDSMADLNMYVRSTCADAMTELGCSAILGPDTLDVPMKAGETIIIFVDGYQTPMDAGPYTLDVAFTKSEPENCADAKDNDLDGSYDCDDSDCEATCGPLITAECAAATPLVASVMGDTSTGTNLFSGTCAGGQAAPEDVYTYTAADVGELQITLSSMSDQALYVRSSCGDAMTETTCVDLAFGGEDEKLSVNLAMGETIYVFVDGVDGAMGAGAYTLTSTFTPTVCGDNKTTFPEECDDGGLVDMDGCDATCKFLPQMETEPNNSAMTANVPFEGKVTAMVMPAGDNDWFKVTVPAGATKIKATTGPAGMDVCMSENSATGEIDTEIQILAANGTTELAFNEDINGSAGPDGNYCSSAEATVMPGDYYVRASASAQFCAMCDFDYSVIISVE